jgi:hypothetical protein
MDIFYTLMVDFQIGNPGYDVCVIMNNTPRKCLGFRTPQEVLDEHLHRQVAGLS